MDSGNNTTTVAIKRKTLERLKVLGKKGESYEDLINLLIDVGGDKLKNR